MKYERSQTGRHSTSRIPFHLCGPTTRDQHKSLTTLACRESTLPSPLYQPEMLAQTMDNHNFETLLLHRHIQFYILRYLLNLQCLPKTNALPQHPPPQNSLAPKLLQSATVVQALPLFLAGVAALRSLQLCPARPPNIHVVAHSRSINYPAIFDPMQGRAWCLGEIVFTSTVGR